MANIDPELKGFSNEEMSNFFRLQPRIFSDYRPPEWGPLKMLFIFSQTPDNADSLFAKVGEMRSDNQMEVLGITDGDLGHGYAGYEASVRRLSGSGITLGFPIQRFDVGGNVNTGSEAQVLAKYAAETEGDIGVVAAPFQLTRAFLTTVAALRNIGAERKVRVYVYPGIPLDWQETAAHSQGTLVRPRKDLLLDELERLDRYRQPQYGSMASAQEGLDYLDWRDNSR